MIRLKNLNKINYIKKMEYIDKSNKSIVLGTFTGTLFIYIFYRLFMDNRQYILDHYSIDLSDIKVYILSAFLSIMLTYLVLILFKEYLKRAGDNTFLTEPFEQKHHSGSKRIST